jgi:hypothetical protein
MDAQIVVRKFRKSIPRQPLHVRFGPKADKRGRGLIVRFVPIADITFLYGGVN